MCWSLRAFLRCLHHRGLHSRPLADFVPSMRRWKLATLPTYLPADQVRKALDGCNRETVTGRRDYAILLLLAKLGLRADEVATLTLDDVDWRASEILVRAKGRRRARMLVPPDVGAVIVAYLRNGRPKSCRRLFVRPHTRARRRLCSRMRSPRSPRPLSISLESKVAHTAAPISSDTVSLPSYSNLARPCRRSDSCYGTRATTPPGFTRRSTSMR